MFGLRILDGIKRNSEKIIDILHVNPKGILKVSPFFYYSEFEMDLYLQRFDLPNEKKYFDPTKVLATRECGIHL